MGALAVLAAASCGRGYAGGDSLCADTLQAHQAPGIPARLFVILVFAAQGGPGGGLNGERVGRRGAGASFRGSQAFFFLVFGLK